MLVSSCVLRLVAVDVVWVGGRGVVVVQDIDVGLAHCEKISIRLLAKKKKLICRRNYD